MALTLRAAAIAAALTTTTILAAPAAAAPLAPGITSANASTYFAPSRYDPAAESAQWGCRRYCGWGGRRGYRRNRVDAGDVLVGAAIIGGVLAIASSTRRRERDRNVVVIDRDPQFRDRRDDRRADVRRTGSAGLDNAVDMCVQRIERDVRIDAIDNVERTPSGWQVSGNIFNGARFECRIGNDGRIDAIDYDGTFGAGDWREPQAAADVPAPGQWDAEAYANARAGIGGTVRPDIAVQETEVRGGVSAAPVRAAALPAYPGGPVPGEVIPETLEEATGG
jgi:hypothetical protein